MKTLWSKITKGVQSTFQQYHYLKKQSYESDLKNKTRIQLIIAVSFFILSIANIIVQSYIMLGFTLFGAIVNGLCAFIAIKLKNQEVSAYSSILTCSLLFGFFVVYGGNDGFSCLWVLILPFFALAVMDFGFGLIVTLFFQLFLIVVFWTPLKDYLFYTYNDQFCLRFPLLYFVTNLLGVFFTISLQSSRYNEEIHLLELEKMTKKAEMLANTDPLTSLANRRCAYDRFQAEFSDPSLPHCVVMCDIDLFKGVNDTYGHAFGDEVLMGLADIFKENLPDSYLISRWGGEEFLFAGNEPIEQVYENIEAVRMMIQKHEFVHDENIIKVTMTFGIASYTDINDLEKVINLADDRLYKGKKLGGNCTIIE